MNLEIPKTPQIAEATTLKEAIADENKAARNIVGSAELEFLNPNGSENGTRDPFAGHSYQQVIGAHFDKPMAETSRGGAKYIIAQPVSPPFLEEATNPNLRGIPHGYEYDPATVVVFLAPFGNPIARLDGSPNHIALIGAAIADAVNADTAIFGHPGAESGRLSKESRKKIKGGDFSPIAEDMARIIKAKGYKNALVYGYSQGGEVVPDLAIALNALGIRLKGVVSAAPPGVKKRSLLKLSSDFMDPKAIKALEQEWDRSESLALNEALKHNPENSTRGIAITKLAEYTLRSLYFAKGFSVGTFGYRMRKMAEALPNVPIILAAAENDKVCPFNELANVAGELSIISENVTLFRMNKRSSSGHTWGDYILGQAGLVGLLRAPQPVKAISDIEPRPTTTKSLG